MADRLTLSMAKSIAKHLDDNVNGLDAAYVITPDFDFDKKLDPTNPREKIARDLPFVGIEIISDERTPWSMSSNILYEANMEFGIGVYASSYSNLLNSTGDVKQVLATANLPQTGEVGVPLYDFGTPASGFYDLVGAVDIFDFGVTSYFGPTETDQLGNRKHRSITSIMFSTFKDKDAAMIENLGNIDLND